MTTTTNWGLTLVEPSQAQKEVTINQAFVMIDALAGGSIADKDLNTPPGTPVSGVAYIVAASPTGAWSGKATAIAYFDQIWRFVTPVSGARVYVRDEAACYQFNGTAWVLASNGIQALLATNTATGTTGAQTIHKPAGTVNFAAGSNALVVTNNLVSTGSVVLAVVRSNDSTAAIKNVVPGAGSFTVTLSANATVETSVGFVVFN